MANFLFREFYHFVRGTPHQSMGGHPELHLALIIKATSDKGKLWFVKDNSMEKHFVCRILSLKSYDQNGEGDEIFLRLGKKRIWPSQGRFALLINSPVKIDYSFGINRLGEMIELELWESDNIISRSCIGKFMLPINELGGPFVSDLRCDNTAFSKYSLLWELR